MFKLVTYHSKLLWNGILAQRIGTGDKEIILFACSVVDSNGTVCFIHVSQPIVTMNAFEKVCSSVIHMFCKAMLHLVNTYLTTFEILNGLGHTYQ